MREIKFRAWDKFQKEMITDFLIPNSKVFGKYRMAIAFNGDIFTFTDAELADFKEEDMVNSPIYIDRFELMQFTGLRDDNGKEVYEGDIISIPELGRYEVVFKEGCFGAEDGQGFAPFRQTIWGLGGEVIGNIHDNPSLLGVKS